MNLLAMDSYVDQCDLFVKNIEVITNTSLKIPIEYTQSFF